MKILSLRGEAFVILSKRRLPENSKNKVRTSLRIEWPINTKEARKLQEVLCKKVEIAPLQKCPEYVLGVDVAYFKRKAASAACLYRYPDLTLLEETCVIAEVSFPYVPGYLSFREGPAVIQAIKQLSKKPELILIDGQGIAHPRGLGIASFIGVILDIPTIGCAKSRLVGTYKEPGLKRGKWTSLKYKGRPVGAVLRTKDHVRPLFVSPGHKVDLNHAIEIVLGCTQEYRIPMPLRRADMVSKSILKKSGP